MGTIFDRDYEPPESGPGDTAFALARGVVALVPGASAILDSVFTAPLTQRQQEWMNDIAGAIRQLEEKRGIRPEDLSNNQAFIDAVLTATQAAIRTSQAEKRKALLNAAMNASLPEAPDAAIQQIFLGLVDRLSIIHLRVLRLFENPSAHFSANPMSVDWRHIQTAEQIIRLLPEFTANIDLARQVWAELYASGLVNINTLHNPGEGDQVLKKRTTSYADQFLRFIAEP